ncbi:MAG: TIGR01440 family protein, partial [Oscillospiraceae bacterium]|nr:TIGR01440 family protein [Oscillospiraceae bacterium]
DAVFSGIYGVLKEHGVYLAAQCCEHLNRALIVEKAAMRDYRLERVNVIPQKKAGGSFATAAYHAFAEPVAVEELRCAKAGMDIGDTLIGMHMAKVAVPVRLSVRKIGEANLVCARVRPKFVGGDRAVYDETLK